MADLVLTDMGGVNKLDGLLDFDGLTMPIFGFPPDHVRTCFPAALNLPIRGDDVLLSTPIKSGTHWSFELVSMLLGGKVENTKMPKIAAMLEATKAEDLEKLQSPRVLNSHMSFKYLPQEAQDGKCKIVLVVRNPKDCFCSMYEHHKGARFHNYNGEWKDYLPLLLEGKLEYGSWFDMILDWEKRLFEHPDTILLVHYEDLKENGFKELKRISEFLGLTLEDDFIKSVVDKCSFKKMKVDKAYTGPIAEQLWAKGFSLFRKGEVGDWQNYFTVAQNKAFDELFNEKMKDCSIKFRFTLN